MEGFTRLDPLYQQCITDREANGAKADVEALKRALPEAVYQDLWEHLELEDLQGDLATVLRDLKGCLGKERVIKQVWATTKYSEATQRREVVPGSYWILLAFGEESLKVASVLQSLDSDTRRLSGLPVKGQVPEGVVAKRRRLIYNERTQAERDRAEAHRKGDKNKGKGKGAAAAGHKGKGKGGQNKGKGKGKKGAQQAGQGAAAAAAPADAGAPPPAGGA